MPEPQGGPHRARPVAWAEGRCSERERNTRTQPATVNNIYRDFSAGRHSVYFHLPEDANPQGDDFAFVDLKTGVVTTVSRPAASTRGDRFMAWLYPLHTGAAFGWPGRLLVALAGIATIVVNVTGLLRVVGEMAYAPPCGVGGVLQVVMNR